MSKYVSLDKRSKKAQKEYHSKQRRTWGELNPVTRSVPSGKAYNRKKEKERISKEFRDGFGADSFLLEKLGYASYDKIGMMVILAVMAVTAIGCFVRDRLELV